MAYQVIARKWRPQKFSDMVGQEHIARTLRNAIISGRIAQAYLFNTLKYIENTNSRINVLAGSDSLILWTLMAGGTGAISGCSNVFPELMVSIYNYFIKGDIEKANEAQKKIRPFRNVMQMGNPNSVVKLAANLRGLNVGPARRPSNCTDPKIIEALKEVFKQY